MRVEMFIVGEPPPFWGRLIRQCRWTSPFPAQACSPIIASLASQQEMDTFWWTPLAFHSVLTFEMTTIPCAQDEDHVQDMTCACATLDTRVLNAN